MRAAATICASLAMAVACTGNSGPPLSATDIVIVAPLPGRANAVAYLELHNGSRAPIVVNKASSPYFRTVELHESVITDEVVRMRRLDSLTIPARQSLRLQTGATHLMLIDPRSGLVPGDTISLELGYDEGGILIVNAPVQARYAPGATN